jgi:hypothetical protein
MSQPDGWAREWPTDAKAFSGVSSPVILLRKSWLILGAFSAYLLACFLLYLEYCKPLREGSPESLRIDRVRLVMEGGEPAALWARVKPYLSRDTMIGMGLMMPVCLDDADDPRDVMGSTEPNIITNPSPLPWSCRTGVLFWSSEGPETVVYQSLGWAWRRGRWIRFAPRPVLPRRSFNATIWRGPDFWTVTNIEVSSMPELGFLRILWVPTVTFFVYFWHAVVLCLAGLGIWWLTFRRRDEAET